MAEFLDARWEFAFFKASIMAVFEVFNEPTLEADTENCEIADLDMFSTNDVLNKLEIVSDIKDAFFGNILSHFIELNEASRVDWQTTQ